MKVTVNEVSAGDTIRHHGFNGTVDYLVISKQTSELYKDSTKEVTVKGTLKCRSIDGNKIYNDFFCIADGTFPNITILTID